MSGKKGMKHYPIPTKLEAVRLFLEEGLTRAEAAEALNVRRPELVKAWVRRYRRLGKEAFKKPQGRRPKQPDTPEAELERLRMENELLKKFRAELREDPLAVRNIGSSIIIGEDTP